ncbi:MAG: hypothetical protein COT91_04955 [Candidatus Doudnabacteria bacterium CG10_big_fil_rev_8_21_14_0_10_41_10]|uniref:Uncharacterized protein n=1 Tax=Candidatus Doudnabacteria bacterium CG10_big_fil_rev_8_21_14_0_10_41_10 TaxID=1974551 RepID=A0A2H0VCA6_9BACT|nr:MAG: hypothetical protein COT91_04955 [Candidatus Doudnabacteria bacterium CG10_big_fil_rev_8_21_14_0_10_41_10]
MRQLTELNGNRSGFFVGTAPWSKSNDFSGQVFCPECNEEIDPGSWGVWRKCMNCFLEKVSAAGPWSRTSDTV